MKRGMWWAVLLALGWVSGVEAGSISTLLNQAIPDGDPAGLASTIHISGESGWANSLQVDLDISGTYNGDLYAYLVHDGGFSVLLNRVGRTSNNDLGYGDGGMNVTFADGAANGDIHNYRSTLFGNASTAPSGPLTGTWSPDGRQSSPFAVTDADARRALLSSFNGLDPNGDWTLFVADLSGGDLHQLNSWSLNLNPLGTQVPDNGNPGGMLLASVVVLFLGIWIQRRLRKMGLLFDLDCRKVGPQFFRLTGRVKRRAFDKTAILCSVLTLTQVTGISKEPTREGRGETNGSGRVTVWGYQTLFPLNAYGAKLRMLVSGAAHNLGVTTEGVVVQWGSPMLGSGLPWEVPTGLRDVVAIAAGADHDLALKSDGTLVSWGAFLVGHDSPVFPAIVAENIRNPIYIAAGTDHCLAVQQDGTVVAWGDNSNGQCDVPAGLSGVIAVAGGVSQSLALKSDGTVVAWGGRGWGSPGLVPSGLNGVKAIEAGKWESFGLALKEDGRVVAWGDNTSHQCDVPTGLNGVVRIAAGGHHSLALKADGTVVAWGDNSSQQCDVPAGLSGVVEIAAGGLHSMALKDDGTTVGWGGNQSGQTTAVSGLDGVIAISSSVGSALALKADGTAVDLGSYYAMPGGLTGIAAVAAGVDHSLVLRKDGTIVAWGDNRWGQCDVPAGLANVVAVAAPHGYSLALKTDGTVSAWGLNDLGQCDAARRWSQGVAIAASSFGSLCLKADGTVLSFFPHEPMPYLPYIDMPVDLENVVSVAVGESFSLVLKADGTVVAWGYNRDGQCDVPTGLSNVAAIAAGSDHGVALKADGSVVGWSQAPLQVPFRVPDGLPPVTAIAAGGGSTLALFETSNRPPLPGRYGMGTSRNTPGKVSLFKLHNACSDPDWDTFIVTAVSPASRAGGTALINGSSIVYTPPTDFVGNDSFIYTVRDSRGASSEGTINVSVTASSGSSANILGVTVQADGAATIRFAGIPGEIYSLEASTDLITWQFVASATAGPTGLLQFIDSDAAQYSTRYYRTRYTAPANP